jgi:hypothetical protein
MKQGRLSPPSAPAKSDRSVGGGGVAKKQASGVMDRFCGRREGRDSPEDFSTVEGIDGGKSE